MVFFCICLFFFNKLHHLLKHNVFFILIVINTTPTPLIRVYKKRFSLCRQSFQVRNIMEHESDSEPVSLSTSLPLQSSTKYSVFEHYVLTRATAHQDGPKYVTYNTKSSRLQTLVIHDRPHMLDITPNALSEAGFFFTGKIHTIF